MSKPQIAAADDVVAASRDAVGAPVSAASASRWESRRERLRYRAETERLRVLVDFLARPIHAHGGAEPDPDIISAYNLAVEAALRGIRRAALHDDPTAD